MTPRLWPALLYGVVCALSVAINQTSPTLPVQIATAFVGLISGVMSGATILVWMGDWLTLYYDRVQVSASKTKASELAKELKGLTEEQTRVVKHMGEFKVDVVPNVGGPRVQVHGVPLSFISDEFLPRCEMRGEVTFLAPISSWSEGFQWEDYGERRRLASDFTDYLISIGWAIPATGNMPARLVGRMNPATLREACGLMDKGE